MKLLPGYIISLFLLLAGPGQAQDSLAVKSGKVALLLSADYGKGLESLVNKQTKWEFGLGLLLAKKYNFVAEYGYGLLNPESVINNGSYTAEGYYYRVGFEHMFRVSPKRYLSLGVLYAATNFADYGSARIKSDLWDDLDVSFNRENLSAYWFEVIINTEGPLLKVDQGFLSNFYWGTRFRIRIMGSDLSQPDFDIYAVPGFGRTYSAVVPAVNLFIKYRIDL